LNLATQQDSLAAKELLRVFNSERAAIEMTRRETQIYSSLFLLIMMVISILIFIVIFNLITKPLNEVIKATTDLSSGNLGIKLSEKGFSEIKQLKKSFNRMSENLQTLQKKLIQAEKENIWKGLSRILAHEIKNPLTPIQLSVQRLEEKYLADRQRFDSIFQDSINIINLEIANLQKLAFSFSNFAKDIEVHPQVFSLSNALQKILSSYQHAHKISFHCPEEIKIRFDETHFYQIITNLFQNAVDACEPEQEILFDVSCDQDQIRLSIEDKGIGIKEEDLEKVFEPYFTKKKKGTGLGLALVKKLIDLNDAEIIIFSKPNQGTKFEIILNKTE
jgi:two-component system nitrogen regulation sensor histidine kinase NtrY